MEAPPILPDEETRLTALYKLELLDTPPEERFDRITQMIRTVLEVPMATFTLVDKDRQWFKSSQGVNGTEDPRHISFCAHTIATNDMMVVPDATKDQRFADNPLVTGEPNIVFYIGCPVHSPEGQKVGTLCALDDKPHKMNLFQLQFIRDMAKLVEIEIK